MENEDLTADERRAFQSLSKEVHPPQSLELEVLKNLKEKGLINTSKSRKTTRLLYPVAASIIFLLGFIAGNMDSPIDKDFAYMLILFEDENFHVENPSEVANEYGIWNEKVNREGNAIDGQELWNETIKISEGRVERMGKDYDNRITGYFVLEARTEEEAISIARESPHVRYGGTIQLKRFRVR